MEENRGGGSQYAVGNRGVQHATGNSWFARSIYDRVYY